MFHLIGPKAKSPTNQCHQHHFNQSHSFQISKTPSITPNITANNQIKRHSSRAFQQFRALTSNHTILRFFIILYEEWTNQLFNQYLFVSANYIMARHQLEPHNFDVSHSDSSVTDPLFKIILCAINFTHFWDAARKFYTSNLTRAKL